MMEWMVCMGLVLGGGAAVWGVWDVLHQSSVWGRHQQAEFQRAVRKANMAGRVPPDWDTWVAAQVDESRAILESVVPAPRVKMLAPVIPFSSKSLDSESKGVQ